MNKRLWHSLLAVGIMMLLVSGTVYAQGDDEPEADLTLDWCDVQAGQAALGQTFDAPGWYDIELPTFDNADFGSLPDDPADITLDDLLDLQTGSVTVTVEVRDRGVNCTTGDMPGVERLWDDKMTMVVFRDPNLDLSVYWPNGIQLLWVPYWQMLAPHEPGDVLGTDEMLAGTIEVIFVGEGYYQANWYGPDGGLALAIPFTYPEPCVDGAPGSARVCPPPGE